MVFHPKHLEKYLNRDVTFFCVVPTMVKALLAHDVRFPPTLRQILVVGGSLSPDTLREMTDRFKGLKIGISYGLTEASPRVTYMSLPEEMEKIGSVGKPVSCCTVGILDENGAPLPAGEIGEICVQGSNVMKEYLNARELTANAKPDGNTLLTGDIGYLDQDGYLYVMGRKDNRLKVDGHNLYPEEVENVLSSHPLVRAAVVRTEKTDEYERLVAYIEGGPLDPFELKKFCSQKLSIYKIPKHFYFFDELPKTISGKVKRNAINQPANRSDGREHHFEGYRKAQS